MSRVAKQILGFKDPFYASAFHLNPTSEEHYFFQPYFLALLFTWRFINSAKTLTIHNVCGEVTHDTELINNTLQSDIHFKTFVGYTLLPNAL